MSYEIRSRLIATNIRTFRMLNEKSLIQITQELRVTAQQFRKYEQGKSKIPAVILWQLSEVLNIPIQFFFHDKPVTETLKATLKEELKNE